MPVPRIPWDSLPGPVRAAVEDVTGPVSTARTADGGGNSAVAATLDTPSGLVFVKGIPVDHRQVWTQRQEARINPHVAGVGPSLMWQVETGGWHLLGFEHVTGGRHADYSPGSPDLQAVADTLKEVARIPCPDLPLKRIDRRWAEFAVDGPGLLDHLTGDSLLHTDVAPDNVLVTPAGARLIDWAWPSRGPAWVDVVFLAVRMMGCGHHIGAVEKWAAEQFPAWRAAPRVAVDAAVVLVSRFWAQVAEGGAGPWAARLAQVSRAWAESRVGPLATLR